jgi:hypothetical protein
VKVLEIGKPDFRRDLVAKEFLMQAVPSVIAAAHLCRQEFIALGKREQAGLMTLRGIAAGPKAN